MLRYTVYFMMFYSIMFSYESYKLIRIYNPEREIIYQISQLGAELDHSYHKQGEYIEFSASNSLLDRFNNYNIDFEVIHEDLQNFYESRLYDIESRDFDYGSMGGYYTHQEIIDHLEELSSEVEENVNFEKYQ